jgi:hypothetical protein
MTAMPAAFASAVVLKSTGWASIKKVPESRW